MKTLQRLKVEKQLLISEFNRACEKAKLAKKSPPTFGRGKWKTQNEKIKLAERYLNTEPSENYLKLERERLQKLVDKINSHENYELWKKHNADIWTTIKDPRKIRDKYNNIHERDRWNNQIKMLDYILS